MTVCRYVCVVYAVSIIFSDSFCSGSEADLRYSPRMAPASVRKAASE